MKIYQTKTQADYDALMVKLESEGCEWNSRKPTELSYWERYKENTCVSVDNYKLEYGEQVWYVENYPNTPIIPFTATDNVNHPSHYKQGNQETIDIIEDLVKAYPRKIGYHIGNTIKYICRAPFKNNLVEDLKKARWYLDRAIDNLDKE